MLFSRLTSSFIQLIGMTILQFMSFQYLIAVGFTQIVKLVYVAGYNVPGIWYAYESRYLVSGMETNPVPDMTQNHLY